MSNRNWPADGGWVIRSLRIKASDNQKNYMLPILLVTIVAIFWFKFWWLSFLAIVLRSLLCLLVQALSIMGY